MRRMLVVGLLLAVLAWGDDPSLDQTMQQILGNNSGLGQVSSFSDPAGYFRASVSSAFKCTVSPKALDCSGTIPGVTASLSVKVSTVPASATASLVALNEKQSVEDQPHFQVIKAPTPSSIDGKDAIEQTLTYDMFGNVQLPMWLEYANVVLSGVWYQVTLACGARPCTAYGQAKKDFLKNLALARIGPSGKPLPIPRSSSNQTDSLNDLLKNIGTF